MPFYVSRQVAWPEGNKYVEVAAGGLDYANPGMLVPKYPGEGEEYLDPYEALKAAREVSVAWSRDAGETIGVGVGHTHGSTSPFEAEQSESASLDLWAESEWHKLPKCDQCGEIRTKTFELIDYGADAGQFCSEQCCDKALEAMEDGGND